MSKSLHLRQATPDDIPVIQQLAEATWEPTYRSILTKEQIDYMFGEIYTAEALAKQMQEGQFFWLLEEEGQALGFASFSVKEADRKSVV